MNTLGTRTLSTLHLLLISPALVFMCSLIMRRLQADPQTAKQIVLWYAERMWTLWILLLALPLSVLISGCVLLARQKLPLQPVREASLAPRADRVMFGTTSIAAIILAIVVLHMLAN